MRTILVLVFVTTCLVGCGPRIDQDEARRALEGFLLSQNPPFGLADFELLSVQKSGREESLIVSFRANKVSSGNFCRLVMAEDVLRRLGMEITELLAMRAFFDRFRSEASPYHDSIFKKYENSPINTVAIERRNKFAEPVVPAGGKARFEGTMILEKGQNRWFVQKLGDIKETPDLKNLHLIPDGGDNLLGPRGKADENLTAIVEAIRELRPQMREILTRIDTWNRECRDAVAEGRMYRGTIKVSFPSLHGGEPFEVEADAILTVTTYGDEKLRNGTDFYGKIEFSSEQLGKGRFYGNLLDKDGIGDRHEGGIALTISVERRYTRGSPSSALKGYVRCVLNPKEGTLSGMAIRHLGKQEVRTPIHFFQ